MKEVFINEAFEKSITDYLESKDDIYGTLYNSFLVTVFRLLSNIYGETDILNPYESSNKEALYTNFMKYGASRDEIDNLFNNLNNFLVDNKKYFVIIQKNIIDLYIYKKKSNTLYNNEDKEFFGLLYTPVCKSPLRQSYNYLYADDIYEVSIYYQQEVNNIEKLDNNEQRNLLDLNIYKLFNYKLSDISMMSSDEIKNVNSKIYSYFNINESLMNKEYLLDVEIDKILNKNKPITTGNGYVDILLVMSVIITIIMAITIFVAVII